jgi:hypothetical protein
MSDFLRFSRPILLATWTALLILGFVPPLLREALSDQAWPFYLAERMLEGAKLGVDIVEVNPPLFIWMSFPSVLLNNAFGLHPWISWVIIFGLLVPLVSLYLTAGFLSNLEGNAGRRSFLLLVAGFALFVLPRLDFAEREHLAVVLTLPFVCLTALRMAYGATGLGHALLTGVLGGVGFSLKPHFLVVWIILEVWLYVRLRGDALRRPELIGLVGCGILYAVSVLIFVPEYLPMVLELAPYYSQYIRNTLLYTIGMGGAGILLMGGAAVAFRVGAGKADRLLDALSLAYAGYFLAAILQRKGFSYHYLSSTSFGLLLVARGWQIRLRPLGWQPSGLIVRLALAVLVVVPIRSLADATREFVDPRNLNYRFDPSYPLLLPEVERLAGGQPIMFLSSNPNSGWPLTLDVDARWSSRYMCLWPIVAIYDREIWARPLRTLNPRPYASRDGFELKFSNHVVEDLLREQPRLIGVLRTDSTVGGWGGSRRIDYLNYFGSDPRFREFMSDYREHSVVGAYTLWLRSSP